jgi:hypothetical protein
MAVVRIDDELLKKAKLMLKKEGNKYKYGSISAFLNSMVYEQLKKEVKEK